MLMDPSSYSFHDDGIFNSTDMAPMPLWSPCPEVNFDLTGFEFIPDPVEPPVVCTSAFEKYVRGSESFDRISGDKYGNNVHKRVIAMLRNMKRETTMESGAAESSRGFKHMIRERQRREKLSQSYADLYAMLSSRSKGDKNSIVQSAAMYVRELKGVKDQLHRKNEELKARILGINGSTEEIKVQFEVANPDSGLDSMIAALRRLKSMDVMAKSIRSDLSSNGLATTMTIQTKMAASEVEKEIEEALKDVERDSRSLFPGNNTWPHNSHVENVF